MAKEQEKPDITEPIEERKVELNQLYTNGIKNTPDTPYKGVKIKTLGEVQWIMQQRKWSGETNLPRGMSRANFSRAQLSQLNLEGIQLNNANLNGTNLRRTQLSNSCLVRSDLSGANLYGAKLNNVNLARALMDIKTVLDKIEFDEKTKFLGVRWNNVSLNDIDWLQTSHIGDEPTKEIIIQEKMAVKRAKYYRDAAGAYHGLVVALNDQGLSIPASNYRLREKDMEKEALWEEHKFCGWLFNIFLGGVAGHGEKPGRTVTWYLGIIAVFSVIYWMLTNLVHGSVKALSPLEAVILSLTCFHGRGFFTNTITIGDPVTTFAAIEAVLGLFIELVFIATFSKKFLGE